MSPPTYRYVCMVIRVADVWINARVCVRVECVPLYVCLCCVFVQRCVEINVVWRSCKNDDENSNLKSKVEAAAAAVATQAAAKSDGNNNNNEDKL